MKTFLLSTVMITWAATATAAPFTFTSGQWAFDWLHVENEKCAKVSGALRKKLSGKTYKCEVGETQGSTGKVIGQCRAQDNKREYLVFKTKFDCIEERETQLAHGD